LIFFKSILEITSITVYYFIKIDWERIVGKWFPWTLDEEDDDNTSETKDEEKGRGKEK
jgi:hypothetical protein